LNTMPIPRTYRRQPWLPIYGEYIGADEADG
jgi:hypothetical protein